MSRKGFIVIAHGSRKTEANNRVFELVRRLRNYFQADIFKPAFMESASPSIEESVKLLVDGGINELIVFPFFLFKGVHYSKDVPEIIEKTIDGTGTAVNVRMLEPVGMHPRIFDMVQEMLYDEVMDSLESKPVEPADIENRSMEIIESWLERCDIKAEQRPVIKRVIHTTGDFDFLGNMVFHERAVSEGLKALNEKKAVYTDVTMVQAGINKRFGHNVACVLNEPEVVSRAEREGTTKASAAIKSLGHKLDGNIVAIGNAPTALITLVDMVKEDGVRPALIVGIPVGFVNAKEAKRYLTTLTDVPYITNRGHKGGSTVAAAIVNALIKTEFMDK